MQPRIRLTQALVVMLTASYLFALPLGIGTALAAGRSFYVNPQGSDSNNGTSASTPFKSIQQAIDLAQAGDTINLTTGDYFQDVVSKRNGSAGAPITITGPATAVVKGGGNGRVMQIGHSYLTLQGFSIDGLAGNSNTQDGYRDKLLYVLGTGNRAGVTHLRILGMTFKNAGGECVRLRYFAQNNEIADSSFTNCGVHDFRFGAGGKNGEAIYIGTAPEQRGDGKNPTTDPDQSSNNWIHGNNFNTQGNECVDIKEAASGNVVENNSCTGQKDPESAGFDSRGNQNIFRNNTSYGNLGAGVRLGGDTANDGINNEVYGNTLRDNRAGGIKVQNNPQRTICGNTMANNTTGNMVGNYGSQYNPTAACGNAAPPAQPTATVAPPAATAVPPTTTAAPTATTAPPAATAAPTSVATATPAPPAATAPANPTSIPTGGSDSALQCGVYRIDGGAVALIEAERYSTLNGAFQVLSNSNLSGGSAMIIPPTAKERDANTVLGFDLNVVAGGKFYVWTFGYGKDGSSDSFFVQADSDSAIQAVIQRGSWGWKKVGSTINMTDGLHTLRVLSREPGAQLDLLLITKDKNYTPTKNSSLGQPLLCS